MMRALLEWEMLIEQVTRIVNYPLASHWVIGAGAAGTIFL